jgi:formylglycine-generating enzyme required for sulfatase activity
MVLTRLEELVAEDPGYKDSAALLDQARRQKRLADLYNQARQLHGAEQWLAVVRVFDQITSLDPDYPDPDDLLATARQKAAELQRQGELNDLYRRAVLEMDAGHWEQAQQLLSRLQEQEPGYREADRLLAKAQAELSQQAAERQRQEQIAALYERAAKWAAVGQWAQALAAMDEICTLDPEFADPQDLAARARAEVERQRNLEALYAQAQAARDAQDWPQALAALQAVVNEDAGYRDAAALLAEVEKQQDLAGLYAQAQQQHRAGEWLAVVETSARIAEIEPDFADPEGLLSTAERSLADEQRRAELDDLYTQAAQAMEAGDWAAARPLLAQIREREPGYREAAQLLNRAEANLQQAEAERQRQEQIATLYEQAQSLARARQWRPALAKLDEIHALDATFADPEGIAARARERVAQEEAEAQRQNELAALYAEAVRLLKADQFQEALQKWGEVQALEPRYPDRKKVQATARKKLARLAKPTARRRQPKWARIATGVLIVVAVIVVGVLINGLLSTSPPTPGRLPVDLGVGAVWEWSDGSEMVYVAAGVFWMGSDESDPNAESNEWPQHQVNLDAFWIDRTEVTNAQYRRCVADGGCSPPSDTTAHLYGDYYGKSRYDDYPVINVDWAQANAYCAWAGKRLPTEAEWEKAARGTDRRIYPWGNTFDGTLANFCDANCPFPQKNKNWDDGYADTAPVGSYQGGASPYGAWDMAGNVHEWTTSLDKSYPYVATDGREAPGAAGPRVIRGGSLGGEPSGMRTTLRESRYPTETGIDLGFRCTRSASEPVQASSAPGDTTPTPLPGTEVMPISQMAPSIPWQPYDESATPATRYIALNLSKPPFNNVLVRQAFALAVDRSVVAELSASMGFDRPSPATTFTPLGVLGRDLYGKVGLAFDPSAARERLAQAGYPDGAGFPKTTLVVACTDANLTIAQAVVSMWADNLGVNVDTECTEGTRDDYVTQLDNDAPPIFGLGWFADVNDPDNFLSYFSTGQGASRSHFSNSEFTRLVEEGVAAADSPATRQALYIQAERILCEQEAVIIPLYHYYYSQQ